jgi:hypothetical protein
MTGALFCARRVVSAVALISGAGCGQARTPRDTATSVDPALVEEQRRRIASFDSVVRTRTPTSGPPTG